MLSTIMGGTIGYIITFGYIDLVNLIKNSNEKHPTLNELYLLLFGITTGSIVGYRYDM